MRYIPPKFETLSEMAAPGDLKKIEKTVIDEVLEEAEIRVKEGFIREQGNFVRVRVKGYPIFENNWHRVITFMEQVGADTFSENEFTGDIYPFPEY